METTNKKSTIISIIVIIIFIIAIGAILIFSSKNKAPVSENIQKTEVDTSVNSVLLEGESKDISDFIDSATTFDNESSLVEIENQF